MPEPTHPGFGTGRRVLAGAVLALALSAAGCGGSDQGPQQQQQQQPPDITAEQGVVAPAPAAQGRPARRSPAAKGMKPGDSPQRPPSPKAAKAPSDERPPRASSPRPPKTERSPDKELAAEVAAGGIDRTAPVSGKAAEAAAGSPGPPSTPEGSAEAAAEAERAAR